MEITMTEKEKKEALQRIAAIKLLVQRTCTPVSSQKRQSSITAFFRKNADVPFTEKEYLMIWKGLYYAVWYSEMGKGCEETIDAIVAECMKSDQRQERLTAGFETLANEWKGIDNIRLDKFAYFVRRMTNAMLTLEVSDGRNGLLVQSVIILIREETGLLHQVCGVYVEEMIRVFEEMPDKFSVKAVLILIKALFRWSLSEQQDAAVLETLRKEVLIESLVQLTNSSFADCVIKYQKWLNKMLIAFAAAAETKKQEKVMLATISRVNNEEELRILFEAVEAAAGRPKKRPGKRFHAPAKKRKRQCNL